MGDGLLKVIDMLGMTVAAMEAERDQLRAEVAQLRAHLTNQAAAEQDSA